MILAIAIKKTKEVKVTKKYPVSVRSLALESYQASSDGFNYVSAVRNLSFIVSIPTAQLSLDEIDLIREGVDRNIHSIIGKAKPLFLAILNSSQGKYENLCLLNVRYSDGDCTPLGHILLRLRSLTFSAIGTEIEMMKQIAKSLDANTLSIELIYPERSHK